MTKRQQLQPRVFTPSSDLREQLKAGHVMKADEVRNLIKGEARALTIKVAEVDEAVAIIKNDLKEIVAAIDELTQSINSIAAALDDHRDTISDIVTHIT